MHWNMQNNMTKTKHKMNKIRFDLKLNNALNSPTSIPQYIDTSKMTMAKTSHKKNKIRRYELTINNALNSLPSNPHCIETSKKSKAKDKSQNEQDTCKEIRFKNEGCLELTN